MVKNGNTPSNKSCNRISYSSWSQAFASNAHRDGKDEHAKMSKFFSPIKYAHYTTHKNEDKIEMLPGVQHQNEKS